MPEDLHAKDNIKLTLKWSQNRTNLVLSGIYLNYFENRDSIKCQNNLFSRNYNTFLIHFYFVFPEFSKSYKQIKIIIDFCIFSYWGDINNSLSKLQQVNYVNCKLNQVIVDTCNLINYKQHLNLFDKKQNSTAK